LALESGSEWLSRNVVKYIPYILLFFTCTVPQYLNFLSSIALHFFFNTSIKQRSKCRLCEFSGCSVVAEDSVLVVYDAASRSKFMQRRMSEQRNSQSLG